MIGAPDELPADHLLRLFGSAFWWTGPRADASLGELPTLAHLPEPGPRRTAGKADDSLPGHVLALLLASNDPIRLSARDPEIVDALIHISSVMPTIVNQRSMSTWERGDPVDWFDIVGVERAASAVEVAHLPRDAADYLLSTSRFSDRFDAALGSDTRSPTAVRAFVAGVSALSRLEASESVGDRDLLVAIAIDALLTSVLEFEEARESVARLIAAGDLAAWRALHDGAERIDASVLADVGYRIAGHLSNMVVPESLGVWVERMPASVMGGLLSRLQEDRLRQADPSTPPDWPTALVVAALRTPGQRPELVGGLIATAATNVDLEWLRDPSIDESVRSLLLQQLLADDPSRFSADELDAFVPLLTGVVEREPALAATVLRELPTEERLETLTHLVEGARPVRGNVPIELLAAVRELCDDIPAGAGANLVLAFDERYLCRTAAIWDELVTDTIHRLLQAVLDEPRMRFPAATLIALRSSIPESPSILVRIVDSAFRSPRNFFEQVPADHLLEFERHIMIDAVVAPYPPSSSRLALVATWVGPVEDVPLSDLHRLLFAARRATLAYQQPQATARILRFVGFVVSDQLRAHPRSRLIDDLSPIGAAAFWDLVAADPGVAQALIESQRDDGRTAKAWVSALRAKPAVRAREAAELSRSSPDRPPSRWRPSRRALERPDG